MNGFYVRAVLIALGSVVILPVAGFPAAAKAKPTPAATASPEATPESAEAPSSEGRLTEMSLEDLMGLKVMVTSSSRKAEELRDATSSIYVLSGDDIRRSGLRTLPEALRLVPGLQVARNTGTVWSISTRGFAATFNNKMLVLIDGRSVYNNTTSGVNWDLQDLALEDVDRIEVIRGPGGTLWGANAVNGIINVITKDAKVTQGLYASQLAGTGVLSLTEIRQGGAAGSHGYFRAWGKAVNYGTSLNEAEGPNHDAWNNQEAGFRGDWTWGRDNLTVIGGGSHSREFQHSFGLDVSTLTANESVVRGGNDAANGTAKWTHQLSDTSDVEVQTYYDWTHRVSALSHDEIRDTFDLEAQHRFRPAASNELTWGGNFRYNDEHLAFDPSLGLDYYQSDAVYRQYSVFVQDKQTLVDHRLFLTAGTKLEHNEFTKNEWQPSVRLLWTPGDTTSFWAAASRAVRTPSREEQELILPQYPVAFFPALVIASGLGNPDLKAEELVATEAGTRFEPTRRVSVDLSVFYNRYHRMITITPYDGLVPYQGAYLTGLKFNNVPGGNLWGGEANVQWTPAQRVRLALGYAGYGYNALLKTATNSSQGAMPPKHLGTARVYLDPAKNVEITALYMYTGKTFVPGVAGFIPDTVKIDTGRVDLNVTFKNLAGFDLTVGGQNLFQKAHSETLADYTSAVSKVEPTYYAQVTGRF